MKLLRNVALLLLTSMAGVSAAAQTPPPAAPRVPPVSPPSSNPASTVGATAVAGTVHDSLSGWPLRGAVVQLVAAEDPAKFSRTVISDSSGRYSFSEVPDGKYMLGFFHPMLDTLGLPAIARSLTVVRQGMLNADLAIPAGRRMREAICAAQPGQNAGGVVVGVVRDANSRAPLKGARVIGTWRELQFSGGKMVQRMPRRVTITEDNGWFALCDVPGPGILSVVASLGADSTDQVEVDVPAGGFMRRELFLGAARTVAVVDTIPRTDTLALRSSVVHLGNGRLSGTVVAVDGGKPVPNAVVGITNGPQTRANDRGVWSLNNVPPGSRTLELRALGFVPVRRNVDVIEGTPPIRVAMVTFKAVLDTLKVTAGLSLSLDMRQFDERRKTQGMGRFLTAADIYKRNPLETSYLFRNFPGLDVVSVDLDRSEIQMKGTFEEKCLPAIFLNGSPMLNLSAEELDNMVKPSKIIGIEVYSPTSVPAQFQTGMSGCGSVLIWMRN